VYGLAQTVGPEYPVPPHCAHCAAVAPVVPSPVTGVGVGLVVATLDIKIGGPLLLTAEAGELAAGGAELALETALELGAELEPLATGEPYDTDVVKLPLSMYTPEKYQSSAPAP
jgi:hypothetical protein